MVNGNGEKVKPKCVEYLIRETGDNCYSIDRVEDDEMVLDVVDGINHAQVLEFMAVHFIVGVTITWEGAVE